ncbi:hypothetical protein ABEG18_12665 [Alsobacter sp. KACC 23698]|uniref:Uncharacterized protein n=1 Tax=Alsobacter sp. KACC 23698 TaxID=3149229 RepID=A0AAU7JMC3_9HYPH
MMMRRNESFAELQVANSLLRSALTDLTTAFALTHPGDAVRELEQLALQCRERAAYILGRIPPDAPRSVVLEEICDQISDALLDAKLRLAVRPPPEPLRPAPQRMALAGSRAG